MRGKITRIEGENEDASADRSLKVLRFLSFGKSTQ